MHQILLGLFIIENRLFNILNLSLFKQFYITILSYLLLYLLFFVRDLDKGKSMY